MKENREFDMLENADEKTVEYLAEIPVLTKAEKERMLAMSKQKFYNMNRESNINANFHEEEVSGVERYKKPMWHKFASIAACMALVGGIAGTAAALKNSADKVQQTTESSSEVESTTADSQEFTTVDNNTNAELTDVASSLINDLSNVNNVCDGLMDIALDSQYVTSSSAFQGCIYHKVTDSRFKSVSDLDAFIRNTVADPMYSENYYSIFVDNFSPARFIDHDGSLYIIDVSQRSTFGSFKAVETPVITSYNGTDTFTFRVKCDGDFAYDLLDATVTKENGVWKLSAEQWSFSDERQNIEAPSDLPEPTVGIAKNLLSDLTEIDAIAAGTGVSVGNNYKDVNVGGDTVVYANVIDSRFNTLSDVETYVNNIIASSLLSSYIGIYQDTAESCGSIFKEIDGELYYSFTDQKSQFNFIGEPTISNMTQNSFNITSKSIVPDDNEVYNIVTVNVVAENAAWKIENVQQGCILYLVSNDEPVDNENHKSQEENYHDEYMNYVDSILGNVNEVVDVLCGVKVDDNDMKEVTLEGGSAYYNRVTDPRFNSLLDVQDFFESRVCGDYREMVMQSMITGTVPCFKEIDGVLYANIINDGSTRHYSFTGANDVIDVTDRSFRIVADFSANQSGYEANSTLLIDVSRDSDGKFKITSFVSASQQN